MVGDSILTDSYAGDDVESALGQAGFVVERSAQVGDRWDQRLDELRALVSDGAPEQVVLGLGTNDAFQAGSGGWDLGHSLVAFDDALASTTDVACVHLVTVTTALLDAEAVAAATRLNDAYRAAAVDDPRIRIVDWDTVARSDATGGSVHGPLTSDGLHPTEGGAEVYADLLTSSVASCTGGEAVAVVGDSAMVGTVAGASIAGQLGSATFEARVDVGASRWSDRAVVLGGLVDRVVPARQAVLALGLDDVRAVEAGVATPGEIARSVGVSLSDIPSVSCVHLVTVVESGWSDGGLAVRSVNAMLRNRAAVDSRVGLIDWAAILAGHVAAGSPGGPYVDGTGVLTATGSTRFVSAVVDAVTGCDQPVSALVTGSADGDPAGTGTLRAAVTRANAHPGLDAVVLRRGADHSLSRCAVGVDTAGVGDLDVTDALVVFGRGGAVTQRCAGPSGDRVLDATAAVTLRDVHVRGGVTPAGGRGAAVLVDVTPPAAPGAGGVLGAAGGVAGISRIEPALTGDGFTVDGATGAATIDAGDAAVVVRGGDVQLVESHVADTVGGAGLLVDGDVVLLDSAVRGNRTGGGAGAGVVVDGDLLVVDGTIADNEVTSVSGSGSAGGIAVSGVATLVASEVVDNHGARGGGVAAATIRMTGGLIEGNTASGAGGGFVGSVQFDGVVVRANQAGGDGGGGLVVEALDGTRSQIAGSAIIGNQAVRGGGLALASAADITSSTLTGNEATTGGGIVAGLGSVTVTGLLPTAPTSPTSLTLSTVAGNTAAVAAGAAPADDLLVLGGASVSVTAVAFGSPGSAVADCAVEAGLDSLGWSVAADATCGVGSGPGDLAGVGDLEVEVADDASSLDPLVGSPLVDRIPAGAEVCGGVDQRGASRPLGGSCDVGAIETAGGRIGRPSRPDAPRLEPATRTVVVRWTDPPSDAAHPITTFDLLIERVGQDPQVVSDVRSPYAVTGVADGAPVTVAVRSVNARATSEWSPVAGPVTTLGEVDCEVAPFTDVSQTHPFCADIAGGARAGVISGRVDGSFGPASSVSRGAMAALLARLAGVTFASPRCESPPFADVPVTHPFCREIAWLVDEGVAWGYGDGTYRPAHPVARGATAVMLARLARAPLEGDCAPRFDDVPADHLVCRHVTWLADLGVIEGTGPALFSPGSPVSRGAMAAFIRRFSDAVGPVG